MLKSVKMRSDVSTNRLSKLTIVYKHASRFYKLSDLLTVVADDVSFSSDISLPFSLPRVRTLNFFD